MIIQKIREYLFIKLDCNPKCYTFEFLVRYLYVPVDPSSLAVTRFFFGLMMMLDIPDERGGSEIDVRWGVPETCHFPLFPQITPMCFPKMAGIYGIMWIGAFSIMIGYKYRIGILMFVIPYWYILLLDKSFWNNHSYLFGLIGIILAGTQANNYLSIDAFYDETIRNKPVPRWNYFILKYQLIVLYFMAGLKKSDEEWLSGYAMRGLSQHWVFAPFHVFFDADITDYLIVHLFVFIFDLTIAFWMMYRRTRVVAMVFCAAFHLMNTRLFAIGMFPWVCLATMPLFCPCDWPKTLARNIRHMIRTRFGTRKPENENNCGRLVDNDADGDEISWKRKIVVVFIIAHMLLQGFLPYSHFITKGFNNWTNGLYGYSWDMMVHSWETTQVKVKIVDNDTKKDYYVDPKGYVLNDRWTRHGDMVYQYAHCLKKNIKTLTSGKVDGLQNISIYVDVWCSMNGRFNQRLFDSRTDILKARWSPFERVDWLMPMLSDFSDWRRTLDDLEDEVHSWNNQSEVLFFADFPGFYLENYLYSPDIFNTTLRVLSGKIVFVVIGKYQSEGKVLKQGESIQIENVPLLHRIHTIGASPSSFMYTFTNITRNYGTQEESAKPKLPILREISRWFGHMRKFSKLILWAIF